jgi:ribosomal protein L9
VKHTVKSRAPTKKEKERMREPLSKKSLAELQSIASSRGIPFGGMTRTQLLEKIQSYNVQERRE